MIKIFNSNTDPQDLFEFCKRAEQDNRPAAENMKFTDWENTKGSLLHAVYVEKRFDGEHNGYMVYYQDDKIIAGMGYCQCDIDYSMVMSCVRAYTLPGYSAARVYGEMQNDISDKAKDLCYKGEYLSFNEYNLKLMETCYQINLPENHIGYFRDQQGNHWRNKNYRITPMKKAGPYMIRYTKQWILYHLYDESYETEFLSRMESHAC